VVDAFIRTPWVHGVPDAGQREQPRQIPLIGQAANQLTQARSGAAVGVGVGVGGSATASVSTADQA
jgi:hypothetical protein